MTTPASRPAADNHNAQVAPAGAAGADREGFAVSPAIGGLPAIYVSEPRIRAGTASGLWRVTRRAARRAGRLSLHQLQVITRGCH